MQGEEELADLTKTNCGGGHGRSLVSCLRLCINAGLSFCRGILIPTVSFRCKIKLSSYILVDLRLQERRLLVYPSCILWFFLELGYPLRLMVSLAMLLLWFASQRLHAFIEHVVIFLFFFSLLSFFIYQRRPVHLVLDPTNSFACSSSFQLSRGRSKVVHARK